jgi:hypothetical protein
MRFTIGLALVAALGAAACKKKTTTAEAVGSGSAIGSAPSVAAGSGSSGSAGSAEQPAAPPPVDAATGPWQRPAGATAGSGDVDATSLGNAVVVHLVEHVVKPKAGEKQRVVKTLLALEGGGKAIVADETAGVFADDASPAALAITTESDLILPPLTPPRPLQGSDIDGGGTYELEFKGPLLFLVHLKSKTETRVLAVGKDQDSLVVWTLSIATDAVDVAPEWEKTGTIKLAPGATVTGAGSGS